jgi:hypothetical protein
LPKQDIEEMKEYKSIGIINNMSSALNFSLKKVLKGDLDFDVT